MTQGALGLFASVKIQTGKTMKNGTKQEVKYIFYFLPNIIDCITFIGAKSLMGDIIGAIAIRFIEDNICCGAFIGDIASGTETESIKSIKNFMFSPLKGKDPRE